MVKSTKQKQTVQKELVEEQLKFFKSANECLEVINLWMPLIRKYSEYLIPILKSMAETELETLRQKRMASGVYDNDSLNKLRESVLKARRGL